MHTNPFLPLIALIEKAFFTYVEAVLGLLLVAGVINADTTQIAVIAAIPTGLTVIANGMSGVVPANLPIYVDTALRAVRTYAVTFIGLLVAVPLFQLDLTTAKAAAIGAIPAGLAVVKAAIASMVGNHDSAAALPAHLDQAA